MSNVNAQEKWSAYNTGGFTAGFTNGYVARYYGPVPALTVPQVRPERTKRPDLTDGRTK
jgi:hypothetical protein